MSELSRQQPVIIPGMKFKNWRIQEITGYEPVTTFYMDFSIADAFGVNAIKDTYRRAKSEWKNDYKYMTELAMVLNWKISEHYEKNNKYADLYNELWEKQDIWCNENLKGDELSYYFRTTD